MRADDVPGQATFDTAEFFSAIDKERVRRSLTWKQVSGETRISQQTLSRLAGGDRPNLDNLVTLLAWADLKADDFVRRKGSGRQEAELVDVMSAYLRADRNLSPQAASAMLAIIRASYEALRDRPA